MVAGKPRVLAVNAPLLSPVVIAAISQCCRFLLYFNEMQNLRKRQLTKHVNSYPSSATPLEAFTWQNLALADGVTWSDRPGTSSWRVTHLSCKRDY